MKNFYQGILLSCLAAMSVSSCSKIITGIYGIHNIETVDKEAILKYEKKYRIPNADSYQLDTSYFTNLFSLDTIKYKSQIKNHYQPLQTLYYDNKGNLQSFHVNCYAGGFPNLKWNRDGNFKTFLPKQQAAIDSILPLYKQLEFFIPLHNRNDFQKEDYDIFVVVFWNKFMGRQSKRLVQYVQKNVTLSQNNRVKIIYVNNDNIFAQHDNPGSR